MQKLAVRLYLKARAVSTCLNEEHGQDLVEYAAVIALVVLALVGGMTTLANGINTAMSVVSTNISSTFN